MPKRSALRLTKRIVERLKAEDKDAIFWDRDLAGFGVRVHATGRKLYIVQSRGPAGLKRVTLGPVGSETIDKRRREAAIVIDRIKRGEDPKPPKPAPEPTVADLAARCLKNHVAVRCKPNTAKNYRMSLQHHILPALGTKPLKDVASGRRHGASPQAARHPLCGQPGNVGPVQDVHPRRELGDDSDRTQPVPACPLLPRAIPRALSDAGGVPAAGGGAEEVRGPGLDAAVGRGRYPPIDADRLPVGRNPHPEMGRRRPHGTGVAPARCENRPAHGASYRSRAEGARRHRASRGRSLGPSRRQAEVPSFLPFLALAADQAGDRAPRRSGPRLATQLRLAGPGPRGEPCR